MPPRWPRVALAVAAVGALATAGPARADDPTWTAKLVARADDIAAKVATLRGLAIKRTIAKGVMDDAGLRARILLRMDEDASAAERAADAAVGKRWGLVPMATDVDKLVVDLLTEQIAGFYDPAEAKLYVSAKPGTDDTWADMLMAHEITHALQDQHFGLTPWMKAVKDDNDAATFSTLGTCLSGSTTGCLSSPFVFAAPFTRAGGGGVFTGLRAYGAAGGGVAGGGAGLLAPIPTAGMTQGQVDCTGVRGGGGTALGLGGSAGVDGYDGQDGQDGLTQCAGTGGIPAGFLGGGGGGSIGAAAAADLAVATTFGPGSGGGGTSTVMPASMVTPVSTVAGTSSMRSPGGGVSTEMPASLGGSCSSAHAGTVAPSGIATPDTSAIARANLKNR